jgi:hypothetical protein
MNTKKIFKTFIVGLIMVFSISSTADTTYAYWASNIEAPIAESVEVGVSIGDWIEDNEYDPNTTYSAGDIVTYQGRTYRARTTITGLAPRSVWYWFFFWADIT